MKILLILLAVIVGLPVYAFVGFLVFVAAKQMIVDGHEMTASHREADIYKGCVALMQELMGRFEEYLEFIGVEPKEEDNEECFWTEFYNTKIVERLFLWNTHHSGGTSQRMKCRELGIDSCGTVRFADSRLREAGE